MSRRPLTRFGVLLGLLSALALWLVLGHNTARTQMGGGPAISLEKTLYEGIEGQNVLLRVLFSSKTTSPGSFNWTATGGTAKYLDGDYAPDKNLVSFNAGVDFVDFPITLKSDPKTEVPYEDFTVTITPLMNCTLGSPSQTNV